MIYALEILNWHFVKIGFTEQDVEGRIASLQTGCPFEIKKILVTHGTLVQEKQMHKALATMFLRIRLPMPPNEWYPGTHNTFRQFINALKYGPDTGLYFLDRYNPMVKQPGTGGGKGPLTPNIRWPTSTKQISNRVVY